MHNEKRDIQAFISQNKVTPMDAGPHGFYSKKWYKKHSARDISGLALNIYKTIYPLGLYMKH